MLGLKRIWVQLTADRKKFGLLCTVLAIGLLLWMRMILISDHPRTAMANDQENAATAMSRIGSDNQVRPVRRVTLTGYPSRDPFVISDTHFPLPKTPEGFVEDASKSGQQEVEDPELAEARFLAWLEDQVSKFRLEASMHSLVLIDGRRYRLHDELAAVDGSDVVFRIVEIHDRSVVVEHEGRRFELTMKSPNAQDATNR